MFGFNRPGKSNQSKKVIISIILVLFGLSLGFGVTVWAEQSGSTPDSGADSRIKAVYDALVSLSYGSEGSGSWGDWGSYWNRIRSAAEWVPDGSSDGGDAAAAQDVRSGKNFYADGTRTQLAGSAEFIDYSLQSLQVYDDYLSSASSEEGGWTQISSDPEIWQDDRTELYWSEGQDTQSDGNVFSTDCTFFTTEPRGSYDGSDGTCGAAINECAVLTDGGYSNWYLPTQKELQQAYINGIYNQTNTPFATTSYYWSSTELSDGSDKAWRVTLSYGFTSNTAKDYSYHDVRCVRRD